MMAKNPRLTKSAKQSALTIAPRQRASLSSRGKKWIAVGVCVVITGFWLLTFTDPAGQNWASTVSPMLLVLGYTFIGIGLVIPTPSSTNSATSSTPTQQP